jgi:Putative Actinobacterial Holin-X, holin superfamily III
VLALTGRNRLQEAAPMAPEQTIETMKEDVEWARSQAKSARG